MEKSPEIQMELLEISPLVAGISRKGDLYDLPDGYFDNLSAILEQKIRTETIEMLPGFLDGPNKRPDFPIPGNYFEEFPGKLMNLIKARLALSAEDEIAGLSPLISGIGRKTPYMAPEGYFNSLSENLIGGIHESVGKDREILPAFLNDLKTSNLFQVPRGYFNHFPEAVLARINQKSGQAKIIAMGMRRSFLRYAAAAVIAGALLVGGSLFFHPSVSKAVDSNNPALAAVSDQEILNYLENQNVPLTDMNQVANVDINENDAKDLLGDVSDEELQQYLNEHVSPRDLKDN
jgi:hypothetical protein